MLARWALLVPQIASLEPKLQERTDQQLRKQSLSLRYRAKSGERISDEIEQLYRRYHIRYYFGADDNFFND